MTTRDVSFTTEKPHVPLISKEEIARKACLVGSIALALLGAGLLGGGIYCFAIGKVTAGTVILTSFGGAAFLLGVGLALKFSRKVKVLEKDEPETSDSKNLVAARKLERAFHSHNQHEDEHEALDSARKSPDPVQQTACKCRTCELYLQAKTDATNPSFSQDQDYFSPKHIPIFEEALSFHDRHEEPTPSTKLPRVKPENTVGEPSSEEQKNIQYGITQFLRDFESQDQAFGRYLVAIYNGEPNPGHHLQVSRVERSDSFSLADIPESDEE